MIGDPSTFKLIRKVATLVRVLFDFLLPGCPRTPHDGSGIVHSFIVEVELLKLKKSGQFPDESVRITV